MNETSQPQRHDPRAGDAGEAAATFPPAAAELAPPDPDGTWAIDRPGGPCRTWPLLPGCYSCMPANPAEWLPEHRWAVETATEMLWHRVAGRVGLCRETVRPCRQRHAERFASLHDTLGFRPELVDGRWRNISCGCRDRGSCGCGPVAELQLPGPVHVAPPNYPLEVWLDGHLFTAWTRYDGTKIIRTDGQRWPDCQYLDRPLRPTDTNPAAASGTFGIVYWRGTPVPAAGMRACAVLTCEVLKACYDPDNCRIPKLVELIEREGVTYRFVDPQTWLDNGRTGLPEVDLFITSHNPHGHASPPGVYSPDLQTMWSQDTTGHLGGLP